MTTRLFLGLAMAAALAAQSVNPPTPARQFRRSTFSNLGNTATNDRVAYCTNCVAEDGACQAGGTGAFAFRTGGAWVCSTGSGYFSLGTGLLGVTVEGQPREVGVDDSLVAFYRIVSSDPVTCETGFDFNTTSGTLFFCDSGTPRAIAAGPGGGGGFYSQTWSCYRDAALSLACNFAANSTGSFQIVQIRGGTSGSHLVAYRYSAAAEEKASVNFVMPVAPTTWTFDIATWSESTSAVTYTVERICSRGSAAPSTTWTDAVAVGVTPAASGRLIVSSVTISPTGCLAGDFASVRVSTTAVQHNIVALSTKVQ